MCWVTFVARSTSTLTWWDITDKMLLMSIKRSVSSYQVSSDGESGRVTWLSPRSRAGDTDEDAQSKVSKHSLTQQCVCVFFFLFSSFFCLLATFIDDIKFVFILYHDASWRTVFIHPWDALALHGEKSERTIFVMLLLKNLFALGLWPLLTCLSCLKIENLYHCDWKELDEGEKEKKRERERAGGEVDVVTTQRGVAKAKESKSERERWRKASSVHWILFYSVLLNCAHSYK